MKKNETIDNNTLDLDFVRHRRYEDFSMVPTKPYEMLLTEGVLDIVWPCNGYFFFIDTITLSDFVLENLEMIHDIGFRIFKVDDDIALVINAYGINYDIEYFLPLYELLLGDSADEVIIK